MAREMNFVRDTLEKVLRLMDILKYINHNPLTRANLALKGGTAINLTVFNLPRLSVDIDLDFSQNIPREEMLITRENIKNDLKKYMLTQGYCLSPQSRKYHSLDSLIYTYKNLGGTKDNIKIEINYSLRAHILEPSLRKVSIPQLNDNTSIMTLDPMELFAAKINALLDRAAPRDLYDVHNMIKFKLFKDNQLSLFRKCIVFYTAITQDITTDVYKFNKFNAITAHNIKTELLPVIKKGEYINLENIKTSVDLSLKELLSLEQDELKFIDEFRNKKYCPEILFDDDNIVERIKEHPMALWKIRSTN